MAAFRAVPSDCSSSALTLGASFPNSGPMARMTGSARQRIRSHAPMMALTVRAFARIRARSPSSSKASRTSPFPVTTTTSPTGQRSFRLPACRAVATASSNDLMTSMAASRFWSIRRSSASGQSSIWTLSGSPERRRFL